MLVRIAGRDAILYPVRPFCRGRLEHSENPMIPLFTPCTVSDSLLEAVTEAANSATAGDVVLHSLARSSPDQFQYHRQRAKRLCQTVKSISGGRPVADPHMNGGKSGMSKHNLNHPAVRPFSLRGFLRENHEANPTPELTSQKGRHSAKSNE
jgi:hypothetical protein